MKNNNTNLPDVFASYPDVVNVNQLREMLGNISRKTAYGLLQRGEIHSIVVGKAYRIPKVCVIDYLGLK